MKHTKIKDLLNSTKPIDNVTVKGWVRTFRNNQFLAINDGSVIHNIQAVVDFENTPAETLKRLTTSAAVLVTGNLAESQGAGQKFEIQVKHLEILGDSDGEKYPIQLRNKPSLDFVMKIAESFPDVDLYWLLNGTGDFPKKEGAEKSFVQPIVQQAPAPVQPQAEQEEPAMQDLFSAAAEAPQQPKPIEQSNDVSEKISSVNSPGDIERIVVFYKNGVFKNYNPNN